MFKSVFNDVWAFDAEWVPDPKAGRLLYKLSDDLSDREVIKVMWEKGGATPEDPQPFLKTIMCKLVSLSAVTRHKDKDGHINLHLVSLPKNTDNLEELSEKNIIKTFLNGVGDKQPQIVGFNSSASDMLILVQRAIINGLSLPKFTKRPNKPWEGNDYFDSRNSEAHIDLKDIVSTFGRGTPSLNELATLSGIPGKMDVDGNQVVNLWLDGKIDEIIAYNEFDALTTYLVWLRIAYFGGFINKKQYEAEQELLKTKITEWAKEPKRDHLEKYLVEWERLKKTNEL